MLRTNLDDDRLRTASTDDRTVVVASLRRSSRQSDQRRATRSSSPSILRQCHPRRLPNSTGDLSDLRRVFSSTVASDVERRSPVLSAVPTLLSRADRDVEKADREGIEGILSHSTMERHELLFVETIDREVTEVPLQVDEEIQTSALSIHPLGLRLLSSLLRRVVPCQRGILSFDSRQIQSKDLRPAGIQQTPRSSEERLSESLSARLDSRRDEVEHDRPKTIETIVHRETTTVDAIIPETDVDRFVLSQRSLAFLHEEILFSRLVADRIPFRVVGATRLRQSTDETQDIHRRQSRRNVGEVREDRRRDERRFLSRHLSTRTTEIDFSEDIARRDHLSTRSRLSRTFDHLDL